VIGQAYDARAVDRTIEMAREARQHRVRPAAAAEERHFDAALVVLVDQHRHVPARFQRRCDPERRVGAAGDHRAHGPGAQLDHRIRNRAQVRPRNSTATSRPPPLAASAGISQLARCAREHQERACCHRACDRTARRRSTSIPSVRMEVLAVVVPQPVEMGELARHATEIVHTPIRMRSISAADFPERRRRRLARPDAVLGQPRPDPAARGRREGGEAVGVDPAQSFEQPDREPANHRIGGAPERHHREAATGLARSVAIGGSEAHDDLAEHFSAFEPLQSRSEIRERNLGVDHRCEPRRHLGEAVADVAHRGAERSR